MLNRFEIHDIHSRLNCIILSMVMIETTMNLAMRERQGLWRKIMLVGLGVFFHFRKSLFK